MPSSPSEVHLEALRLYDCGFGRKEARAVLLAAFPDTPRPLVSKQLTRAFGRAWYQSGAARPYGAAGFYLTSPPPEYLTTEEQRAAERAARGSAAREERGRSVSVPQVAGVALASALDAALVAALVGTPCPGAPRLVSPLRGALRRRSRSVRGRSVARVTFDSSAVWREGSTVSRGLPKRLLEGREEHWWSTEEIEMASLF